MVPLRLPLRVPLRDAQGFDRVWGLGFRAWGLGVGLLSEYQLDGVTVGRP